MTDAVRTKHGSGQSTVRSGAATVTLAHGGGGRAMQQLIQEVLLPAFGSPLTAMQEDQARIPLPETGTGERLAFTTDSYVVDPLFFPGGNIGDLAINGTINDLVTGGARPIAISCGLILEEGLEIEVLREVAESMGAAARKAGVRIMTGDTKVVARGAADRMFINTSGVGIIPGGVELGVGAVRPGDRILVNGTLGDHGAAVLCARGDMALDAAVQSDTQSLGGLVESLMAACPNLRCMRDATRGGLVSILNEIAESAQVSMRLHESALPVLDPVRGVCEILGIDPLYLANEGKLAVIVPESEVAAALEAMRADPAGVDSCEVGEVLEGVARVTLATEFGGERLLDMLSGEQLPRIC